MALKKAAIRGLFYVALMTCAWTSAYAQNPSSQRALLDRYCVTCHTQRQKERGAVPIALDTPDVSNIPAQAELWEKVIRKMRGGLMPPPGLPRPDSTASQNLVSWLERELDRALRPLPIRRGGRCFTG